MTNTGNRRRFLRTAAVAAAATTLPVVPAIAGEPDPIFTAIEHHRKAAKLVHKLRLKTQRQEAAIETKPEVILNLMHRPAELTNQCPDTPSTAPNSQQPQHSP